MNSLRSFLFAVVAAAFLSFSGCVRSQNCFNPECDDVSMIRLLANPVAFEQKQVGVKGFLHMDTNTFDCALYLGEGDFLHDLTRNAIAISLPPASHLYAHRLNHRYVWIRGTFTDERSARGRHGGALVNVVLVDVLTDLDELGPTNAVFLRIDGDIVKELP